MRDDPFNREAAIALHEAALAIAARGWPVFPLRHKGAPLLKDWPNAASTDPTVVRRLFSNTAARLIGVPTGERSGLDCLDLDPRNGSDDWDGIDRLPESRIHVTPSGGRHWLFIHAAGVRNDQSGAVAPGVDVRGQGGYIAVPPSPGYAVISDADVAPWPAWLLPAVLKPAKPRPIQWPEEAEDDPAWGPWDAYQVEAPWEVACDPKPKRKRHGAPGRGASEQERYRRYIERFVANIVWIDGHKHDTLLKRGQTLGGLIDKAQITEAAAISMIMARLPDSVDDWPKAARTAKDAIRFGQRNPITLEDRPCPRRHRGLRRRIAA